MPIVRATSGADFFFFNDTATTEIYTLSLHDALPIFSRRARSADTAAGDDHRPLGGLERRERRAHVLRLRLRAERRNAREHVLDQRLHLRLFGVDLALVAAELQVHRAGGSGDRDAERLAHHVGEARDVVDGRIELRHRLARRNVVDLLVHLPELGVWGAPAGHVDYRGKGEG